MNIISAPQVIWVWIYILLVAAILCSFGLFYYLRRARLIEDTPTSKIRSASQGYIELVGNCDVAPQPVVSPLTGAECIWYAYIIEKKYSSGKSPHWKQVDQGSSEHPIILEDGTGQVLINPDKAEIIPTVKRVWYGVHAWPSGKKTRQSHWLSSLVVRHDYRYTEKRFHQGDIVYALGEFISIGNVNQTQDINSNLNEKLRKWKQKPEAMLRHFDSNKDGIIDPDEWEKVREAARKLVIRERLDRSSTTAVHTMGGSKNGRPSKSQREMSRRYRIRAIACLIGFILTGPYATWLILKNI